MPSLFMIALLLHFNRRCLKQTFYRFEFLLVADECAKRVLWRSLSPTKWRSNEFHEMDIAVCHGRGHGIELVSHFNNITFKKLICKSIWYFANKGRYNNSRETIL